MAERKIRTNKEVNEETRARLEAAAAAEAKARKNELDRSAFLDEEQGRGVGRPKKKESRAKAIRERRPVQTSVFQTYAEKAMLEKCKYNALMRGVDKNVCTENEIMHAALLYFLHSEYFDKPETCEWWDREIN